MPHFSYYKDERDPRRTLTIAHELADDGTVNVGYAICSPRDQFARKRGRLIATGRLRSGKLTTIVDPLRRDDHRELARAALVRVIDHYEVPTLDVLFARLQLRTRPQ